MSAPAIIAPDMRLRAEWAETLCFAIGQCHPHDAAAIMAAALEDMTTTGPQHDPFERYTADAEWWAELAPAHELQAYVYAGLKDITRNALGRNARKRFIATLWKGLSPDDRRAFIIHVSKGGG